MTNADSRFATMRAMSEKGTFSINSYKDWTVDWAKVGDQYYSNKAPGPMLLGFPLFFIADKTILTLNPEFEKVAPKSSERALLNLLIQVIPIFLMALFIMSDAQGEDEKGEYLLWVFALFFFGNTGSLFFNAFMGHGIAAAFTFWLAYSLYKERYFQVGLAFGCALLCEYAAGLMLLPLVFLVPPRRLKDFILGGIGPGLLWIWYHFSVTGSPFKTVTSFMNPQFLSPETHPYMGMLSFPNLSVLGELLWGLRRSLLYTQPWIFLILIMGVRFLFTEKLKLQEKKTVIFCVASFLLILTLNISFNGWHGGATSGPRYLSIALTPLCMMALLVLPKLSRREKGIFALCFVFTMVFRTLVYGTTILAAEALPLWEGLMGHLKEKGSGKQYFRMIFFFGSMVSLFIWSHWKLFQGRNKNKVPNIS